jgi:hypothetical protein
MTSTMLVPIEDEEGTWVGDTALPDILVQTGTVNDR